MGFKKADVLKRIRLNSSAAVSLRKRGCEEDAKRYDAIVAGQLTLATREGFLKEAQAAVAK